ncbi:uncharacterized protein LTR77_004443 [Saxophila tyrrhenica]|uniref:Uncharacterized protein n=1 Tax=Saxophila tyrrhenica TaxID=1690608 RepID=A0AAV9PCY7_9PEZI|nr:hypothetical protein LTR77_004443 [Saxophila tyrrhenica]
MAPLERKRPAEDDDESNLKQMKYSRHQPENTVFPQRPPGKSDVPNETFQSSSSREDYSGDRDDSSRDTQVSLRFSVAAPSSLRDSTQRIGDGKKEVEEDSYFFVDTAGEDSLEGRREEASKEDGKDLTENDSERGGEVSIKTESEHSDMSLNNNTNHMPERARRQLTEAQICKPLFVPTKGSSINRHDDVTAVDPPREDLTLQFKMPQKGDRGGQSVEEAAEQVSEDLSSGMGSEGFTHVSLYYQATWTARYTSPASADAAKGRRLRLGYSGYSADLQAFRPWDNYKPPIGAKAFLCRAVPLDVSRTVLARELMGRFPESTIRFKMPCPFDPREFRARDGRCMILEFEKPTDIIHIFCPLSKDCGSKVDWTARFHTYVKREMCMVCSDAQHRFAECPEMRAMHIGH